MKMLTLFANVVLAIVLIGCNSNVKVSTSQASASTPAPAIAPASTPAPAPMAEESTPAVDCQKAYGQKACEGFALKEWLADENKKFYACSAFDTDFTRLPGDGSNRVFIALAKGEFLDVAQASFYSGEQEKVLWGGDAFMNHRDSRPRGNALLLHGEGQTASEDKTVTVFLQPDKSYLLSLGNSDYKPLVRVSGQCSRISEGGYYKAALKY